MKISLIYGFNKIEYNTEQFFLTLYERSNMALVGTIAIEAKSNVF